MPIINYEDYYKPPKPQPKPQTKYYQPPKPKATPPPKYTDYSQGKYGSAYEKRPPDIRYTGVPAASKALEARMFESIFGYGSWLSNINKGIKSAVGGFFGGIADTLTSQPDSGYAYPLDSPVAAAPPTFNTSREPARGAYGLPATTNIVDRTKWQKSLQNWWMPPTERETPPNTSYMPSFPSYAESKQAQLQDLYGLPVGFMPVASSVSSPWVSQVARQTAGQPAPTYTNYSLGRYANPTRMGGNSAVGMYSDTGGADATPMPPAGKYGRGQFPQILNPDSWLVASQNPGSSYRRETLAELLARGAVDPWGFDPYEIGGSPYQVETEERVNEDDGGGYGWGSGWGSGGGSSYGAFSGVNSYLPGTRAGYGASASSPRYNGYGGARGSSYAGGQYNNQAAWRMPMLVWNI